MSNANRPWKGAVVLLITLLIAILIGCGGGGGGGNGGTVTGGGTTGTTGNNGSGSVMYTIQWPVESRALPSYTLSIVISVFDFGTTTLVDQETINRSNNSNAYNQTVTITLPPGKYTVVAEAKPQANGGGDTIGTTTVTATIANGQSTSATFQFTDLVAKLFIDDLPAQATVGQTIQVNAHAEDSQGNAILLPPAALRWSITSGQSSAIISPTGLLTLLAAGSVTIQVQEVDLGIKATKSITLVQGSTNGVIIIVS